MKEGLKPITITEQHSRELKKLDVGASMKLQNGSESYSQINAWYRAAKKLGIRISIKTTPAGVTVWRVQ